MKRIVFKPAFAVLLASALVLGAFAADAPSVKITHPAKWGVGGEYPTDTISGTVTGAPAGSKVVVYCYAGGQYWVQPMANSYLTSITGSSWSTTTHLGQKYVALLVRSSFRTESPLDTPPTVGGDVLAKSEEVDGRR